MALTYSELLGTIKAKTASSMKIKLILFAVGASLVLGIFLYQKHQISVLTESVGILTDNNAKLEVAVQTQSETVDYLADEMTAAFEANAILAEQLSGYAKVAQQNRLELDSFRGRLESAALKKPTLVERRANAALASVLRQFAEATGDKDETGATTSSDTSETTTSSSSAD